MRKKILLLAILCSIGCSGQQQLLKDLSGDTDSNYILANIYETNKLSFEEIYKGAFFLRIYKMTDSYATPKGYSEGDEVVSSILISVVPDGDYYFTSKLYKIEALTNPKIIAIEETTHPEFTLAIESGPKAKRSVLKYSLKAQ